jgi:hypothetical protein
MVVLMREERRRKTATQRTREMYLRRVIVKGVLGIRSLEPFRLIIDCR